MELNILTKAYVPAHFRLKKLKKVLMEFLGSSSANNHSNITLQFDTMILIAASLTA